MYWNDLMKMLKFKIFTDKIIKSWQKDLQSPIKIWDPKSGQSITTLYAHKGTVMDIQWAKNGYWLASAARDHLVKVILKIIC